jgi:hypothetical protein
LPNYQSASIVIHGRLLLEAKRELLSTTAPVALWLLKSVFAIRPIFRGYSRNTCTTLGLHIDQHEKSHLSPFQKN